MRVLLASLLLLVISFSKAAPQQSGSVLYDPASHSFTFRQGIDPSAAAFGSFEDGLNETGWGILRIASNKKYENVVQMFASGYLEGVLTQGEIYNHYLNMYATFFSSSPPSDKLLQWLKRQDTWVRTKISGRYEDLTDYWKQVALIVAQFDGLYGGYKAVAPPSETLGIFAFQLLNGVGDFLDLLTALEEERRIDWSKLTPEEIAHRIGRNGHCSGLIKLTGDMSDLFSGHSSWFVFGAMNRIFKHYFFDLHGEFIAAKKMSFSSYPGFLESLDDFYMMDSGLVMVQTTNGILDTSIYSKVISDSLLAWQRVRLANSMAHTGREWAELFALHNSGTYNNQYMIVDYKRFNVGKSLGDGTLWVVEQIPGLVESADVTNQLERGYWASYNVPYFPRIYNESGYVQFVEKYGVQFSYQMAPRAQIFRRDQGKVDSLESFKHILRYNDYLHDPISKGDPGNAICSRFDLESKDPHPSGCYDTKVTNVELFKSMKSEAINGPTTQNNIPPFSWTSAFNSSHVGLPQVFNFKFQSMNPEW